MQLPTSHGADNHSNELQWRILRSVKSQSIRRRLFFARHCCDTLGCGKQATAERGVCVKVLKDGVQSSFESRTPWVAGELNARPTVTAAAAN